MGWRCLRQTVGIIKGLLWLSSQHVLRPHYKTVRTNVDGSVLFITCKTVFASTPCRHTHVYQNANTKPTKYLLSSKHPLWQTKLQIKLLKASAGQAPALLWLLEERRRRKVRFKKGPKNLLQTDLFTFNCRVDLLCSDSHMRLTNQIIHLNYTYTDPLTRTLLTDANPHTLSLLYLLVLQRAGPSSFNFSSVSRLHK